MADAATTITPYSSATVFSTKAIPSWLDSYNGQRLTAYDLYDDLYHNTPGQFKILLRGTDDKPIVMPTAKRICNTIARYVGKGWGLKIVAGSDPITGEASTPEQLQLALAWFGALFDREGVVGTFKDGKKEFSRRGDWVWYILADPLKPAGQRISVRTIDPRTYFPLTELVDVDRLSGAMIVEEILDTDNKTTVIKRQRWLKANNPEHPNYGQEPPPEGFDIFYDAMILAVAGWDDPTKRQVKRQIAPAGLLPGIKVVPLYHIKNNADTSDPFGRSDLNGLENVLAGINQSISDEDLALAMSGLGMWWTNAGAPVGDDGKPTNWIIGPQRVQELPTGATFGRLDGINSVKPSQDHIKYLEDNAFGVHGINDLALGKTQTSPPSGIALALEMAPLMDSADDKDQAINSVLTHMVHDLKTWFLVYEQQDMGFVDVSVECDPSLRLPFDRDARFQELMDGVMNGVFTVEYVVQQLQENFGYTEIPPNMIADLQKTAAATLAAADPAGVRAQQELSTAKPAEQIPPTS